jgi:MFS family permease
LLPARPGTALLLAMLWCLSLGGFALTHNYAVALLLLFVAGFVELAFNAMSQTLVQLDAPPEKRGHIIGVFIMASLGLRSFSGITVGLTGKYIGIHASLALSAGVLLLWVGLLIWLFRPDRTRSNYA